MTRIIDHDPLRGITHYWHDNGDDTYSTWSAQEVNALYERNLSLRNQTKRRDHWGEGKYVGEIPMVTYNDLKRRGIVDDPMLFAKWLDSDEAIPVRTAWGSLSR